MTDSAKEIDPIGMAMVRPSRSYNNGKKYNMLRVNKDHPYYRTSNKGSVSESRLAMAAHLKRNLTNDDVVYHKDNNCNNNDISNLVVLTKKEYYNVQNYVRLKISRDRIISKISVYEQNIIDAGIDPITLEKNNPYDRYREVDRDRESYERSRKHIRGESSEHT